MIEIELCLFNSLAQYTPQGALRLSIPKGTEARELPEKLRIPVGKIYAAWRNGRDIMTTFGGVLQQGIALQDGDRLALSGPIPFSRGYGCPVC
ncbi:MAG TPA: hypothetical protein VEN29_22765 [Casimicrobiaceae bacterium]|nr:hypothetical protein [Casimicrobiaceae bacterium]